MSENYYDTLQSFLTESGVSVLDFSDRIRMFSEMFKELLNTRSKMTIGTFMSVMVGCKGIVERQKDEDHREKLRVLQAKLFGEYLDENKESLLSVANPHFAEKIEEMAAYADSALFKRVHALYHPNEFSDETLIESNIKDPLTALSSILSSLNEEGCRELVKRAKELIFVPEYQKKIIP